MTRNGLLAMLALSGVLFLLGAVAVFSEGTGWQIVGAVLVALSAFTAIGSAKVRGRHVAELERRRANGELV